MTCNSSYKHEILRDDLRFSVLGSPARSPGDVLMLAAIPYYQIPHLELGPLKLYPFGLLVGLAIIVGTIIADKRAQKVGLNPGYVSDLSIWAVVPGFIGAHLYAVLAYTPEKILDDPLVLIRFWDGISSLGGMIGGTLGVWWCVRKRKISFMVYVEPIIYGFAFAWILGRAACTVAFDHPGTLTDFALGMPLPYDHNYYGSHPAGMMGDGVHTNIRHNLGFYEMLWAIGLSLFFLAVRNKNKPAGWFLAIFALTYMPVRFLFDFLRVADATYYGLTPAQFANIALFALGLRLFMNVRKHPEILRPNGEVHVFQDGTKAIEDKPAAKAGPKNSKPSKKSKKKR